MSANTEKSNTISLVAYDFNKIFIYLNVK